MKCMFPIFYAIALCLLGVSICLVQVSAIVHEKEEKEENSDLDGKCVQLQRILELGIKCSMAFLFGGIMSEFRFVKFGHL